MELEKSILIKDIINKSNEYAHVNTEKFLAKPDKSIREHIDDLIYRASELYDMGYVRDEKVFELLIEAAILHDLGKANSEFKKRVESDKKIRFNNETEIPHNVLSMCLIDKNKYLIEEYIILLFAVGFHHDYGNVFEILQEREELCYKLLECWEDIKAPTRRAKSKIADIKLDNITAILVKGFLNICDYSASGDTIVEYRNDFLKDSLQNLLDKWRREDKNVKWNELQYFCEDNKDKNIIAVAQTGMGKTEASLLWIDNNKAFFFLPVRTAINAMYDRIKKDIVDKDNLNTRLGLLHSDSIEKLLSDEYAGEEKVENEIDIIEYNLRSRELSMPLTISTVDQLFDFVFKYQGFERKLAVLSYSKIVIDEIQMYGPELLAYLIYGLEVISRYGGKIAIVTATLFPFVKELLEPIGFTYNEFCDDKVRHNIKVIESRLNINDIIDKYKDNKKKSKNNKILVICNTVKDAQNVYTEIINNLDNDKASIHLLHSRFTKEDRKKKENEICMCGKDTSIKNEIWISTSLVEASLDIDFDYLFTELQDIASLFQRLGRCNRKGKKDTSEANCFIYTEIDNTIIQNGTKGFIDAEMYKLSKDSLRDKNGEFICGELSEKDKLEIINNNFTMEAISGSQFIKKYKDTRAEIENLYMYELGKHEVALREIFTVDIIPLPVYESNEQKIIELEDELELENLNYTEKIKIIEEIKKYTVSVPAYDYGTYMRNVKKQNGKAIACKQIYISKQQKISVMECEYDSDIGYRRMNYNDKTISTMML